MKNKKSITLILFTLLFTTILSSLVSREKKEFAPRPYTAQEIRESCHSGAYRKYIVREKNRETVITVTNFKDSSLSTALFDYRETNLKGEVIKEHKDLRMSWKELRDHAKFEKKKTKISSVLLKIKYENKIHSYKCKLYTVNEDNAVSRYWFAESMPGPPVKYTRTSGGETVYFMQLIPKGVVL